MRIKRMYTYAMVMMLLLGQSAFAQNDLSYQTPVAEIADLMTAPRTPAVSVNGTGDWMLLMEIPGYPSINELSQPELKLAGLRINPRTNGESRTQRLTGLSIKSVKGDKEYPVTGLPAKPLIENVSWSPDGQKVAFTLTVQNGLELWTADLATGKARKLTEPILNDAMRGTPYTWLSDSKTLIFKSVLANRGEAPQESLAPNGPVVQENIGKKAPVRTYQDLLKNPHDAALFTYYASSQLKQIDLGTGAIKDFGKAGVISSMRPSPDGNYVMVTTIQQPYSYLVPFSRFPQVVEMWDRNGSMVTQIANIPLAENIPKGFGAVRKGPRSFTWRSDKPATLYWIEAQDGGDPRNEVAFRDKMFYKEAPFNGSKKEDIAVKHRFGGVTWGNDNLAIAYSWWWSTRELVTSTFKPGNADSESVLFAMSFEDRYNDPGDFETKTNQYGRQVLLTDKSGKKLYLTGQGASPEGNRPFVREFTLATKNTKELWRSQAPYYERPISLININKGLVLTRRESKEEPANYYLRNIKSKKSTALTSFANPYEALKGIEKQVVKYKRNDGVELKGDLYLPKGYKKEDGPLPVLMWAYPNEFKSAAAASQVQGSPYEFIRLSWASPLPWLTRGYAIFDDISMPIVGEGEEEPNDTFRKQLVSNAEAAIDKLVEMGVADRNRVAIGGHSYGAFMTANLLAHSDLFAAGIARSGAYNRTLTPFGFQSEERTYWEAPEIYYTMSPFMHADKVNEPLLMIHGEADNNSGTFPIQSKRFYSALKGMGATTRLVMLPHESHGYRAKESILHMLWEQDQWLEKYVKNRSLNSAAAEEEESED